MAQVILRPDLVISSTGFINGSNPDEGFINAINDDDLNTFATQNQATAEFEVSLENSTEYIGGTITSVVVGASVSKDRVSDSIIALTLLDGSGIIASTQHTVTSSTSVDILNAAVDVNSQGDSLSPSTIDNLKVKLTPNSSGCNVFEVFATITFTPAISNGTVKILQGQTRIINGKVTL